MLSWASVNSRVVFCFYDGWSNKCVSTFVRGFYRGCDLPVTLDLRLLSGVRGFAFRGKSFLMRRNKQGSGFCVMDGKV